MDNQLAVGLAKKYGTPLYIYDGELILKRYKELYGFIKWPRLKIFYAMKANYSIPILKLLMKEGASVDTVSPAEVMLALRLGYDPERILYTANNMTDREMREVKEMGVLFNIDSLSRLEKYGKTYPGSKVCLRFNPDVVAGEHKNLQTGGNLTKFGIVMQDVPKVKKIVKKYRLKVVGLHEHTGSGISETRKVYRSMRNLLRIAKKQDFPTLRFMDFGGGFKVPYHPEEERIDYNKFGEKVCSMFSDFCRQYGEQLELYFEPGKYVVAEAGWLAVQVNTLKNNRGRLIAGTDSGFSQLIRPVLYGAYHHIINLSNPNGKQKRYDVCGNICETGDCFARERMLPEIREGDYLAIMNAGAYCYSMGSPYNLRPMPSEAMVLKNKHWLARKRATNEELVEHILGESK